MKLKTELTMKEYIRTNIIIFILWLTVFIWGLMVIGSEGSTGDIHGIYLLFAIVILKTRSNYKINKSKIAIFLLIPLWILSIYLGSIINSTEYIIITPIFLQTFINLIFIKEVRKKAIANIIIFHIIVVIAVILNYVINSDIFSFIINTLLIIILALVLFYQKMLEYKYVRYITENIEIESKMSNLSKYIFSSIFTTLLFLITSIYIIFFGISYNKGSLIYIIVTVLLINSIKLLYVNRIIEKNKIISFILQLILLSIFVGILITYSEHKIAYDSNYEYMFFSYFYFSLFLYSIFLSNIKIIPVINCIIFCSLLLVAFLGNSKSNDVQMFMVVVIGIQKYIEYRAVKTIDEEDIY